MGEGGGGSKIGKKKLHVLFEWPHITAYVNGILKEMRKSYWYIFLRQGLIFHFFAFKLGKFIVNALFKCNKHSSR
jgi:hypothetical protein